MPSEKVKTDASITSTASKGHRVRTDALSDNSARTASSFQRVSTDSSARSRAAANSGDLANGRYRR